MHREQSTETHSMPTELRACWAIGLTVQVYIVIRIVFQDDSLQTSVNT